MAKITKEWFKRSLWLVLAFIFFLNLIAFFHAYKFTHFSQHTKLKTKDALHLTLSQKIATILFGIDNPRPENNLMPRLPYKEVTLQSNKRISGWHIDNPAKKGTVLLFHGYSGQKSGMLDKAEIFYKLGYSVFLIDFMGSGASEGNQTTIGFQEAAEVKSAFDYIEKSGEAHIVLFGTSMGSVAIMKAIADYKLPVSGLILECPFGTTLQTVKNRFEQMHIPVFPMAHLLTFWGGAQNGYNAFAHNPEDYAKTIKIPTILLYGGKDNKVTLSETESIYHNLMGRKTLRIYPEAGHENYLRQYQQQWTNDINRFLLAL